MLSIFSCVHQLMQCLYKHDVVWIYAIYGKELGAGVRMCIEWGTRLDLKGMPGVFGSWLLIVAST